MSDTTKAPALRGPKLLCAAVNAILAHPETWDQAHWHCGTTHCIAGHCEIVAGVPQTQSGGQAKNLLGLSDADEFYLFDGKRSLTEIYAFAKVFKDGYDRDGYGRAGYNRDGEKIALVPFVLD